MVPSALFLSWGSAAEPADKIPGGIKLLPEYRHEREKGIDTRVGKIWKEGGILIRYDIGRGAGNAVNGLKKENLLWSKEQVVNESPVLIALTKDRMLYVTFPKTSANFYGKAGSEEDVADMLLMILNYTPPAAPR
jgi:hypothetical protein